MPCNGELIFAVAIVNVDGPVAIVRSDGAAIRALGTWSLQSLHGLEVIREVVGGD